MNWDLFENRLKEQMDRESIPGVAIAVSQSNKIIYEKGFGVRSFETNRPATPETIFGTASVTKSLTALAIMQLADQGELSLNDSVSVYLPSFNIKGIEPIESLEIHHLLTHSTGLAPVERQEEFNKFKEHLTYLREETHELLSKPGDYFSYSNDAFLLLGAIIEKVSGRLYRRYITEEILYPLGMNRSTYSIEELNKMCNVSVPYVFNKFKDEYEIKDWPKLGNYEAGGGLRSSVRDLMNYGELYLNNGKSGKNQLVSNDYLKLMYEPYIGINPYTSYGYGFKVTQNYHGTTLVEHSGGQPGVSSNFGFIPEKNLCVAILTNVSGASAQELWLEAVNTVLELPIETQSNLLPNHSIDEKIIHKFIGEFASKEGDFLKVTLDNEQLIGDHNGETSQLEIRDNDLLMNQATKKPIKFYFDEVGKSWAIFIGMRMLLRRK